MARIVKPSTANHPPGKRNDGYPQEEFEAYQNKLRDEVAKAWQAQGKSETSGIVVDVDIRTDNKEHNFSVSRSSGNDSLDKAALATVKSIKIDPLPVAMVKYFQNMHAGLPFPVGPEFQRVSIWFDDFKKASKEIVPDESITPFFGHKPEHHQFIVIQPADDAKKKLGQEHLAQAIEHLQKAVSLDPSLTAAQLGLAWCLDQSGQKDKAIALYRQVFKTAYEKDVRGSGGLLGTSLTGECGKYLCADLNATSDATEIADIQKKMGQVDQKFTAITPILVPLTATSSIDKLIAKNHVQFDLDGNGKRYCRSWISPKAGWLVYDKSGTGRVDSGLQLVGQVTFWMFWNNGYEVLRSLDDNHDGKLTGNELRHLAIWNDTNGDGVTQQDEVKPLAFWHITELSCSYSGVERKLLQSGSGVKFADGSSRPTYDVWIEQEPRVKKN